MDLPSSTYENLDSILIISMLTKSVIMIVKLFINKDSCHLIIGIHYKYTSLLAMMFYLTIKTTLLVLLAKITESQKVKKILPPDFPSLWLSQD